MQEKIIQLSNEILNYLLEFKKKNPEFTFSLRKRNSVQALGVERLASGQWFQGADYIYVPLFSKGDSARKIKTIGFVIKFDKDEKIVNYLEISFKSGVDGDKDILFHNKLAEFAGLTLNSHRHGVKGYANQDDIFGNLLNYITEFRSFALKLLKQLNIEDNYLITESEFDKNLQRIEEIRNNTKSTFAISAEEMKNDDKSTNRKCMLNQILFGPPGTGKTFNSINKAIEIINPNFDLTQDRALIKDEYDRLVLENQIVFTTFHQSMSYEDFIEGIKPETKDGTVIYDVISGIFLELCEKAESNWEDSKQGNKTKLSFEEAFLNLREEWDENEEIKFPLKREGNDFTIIGFTKKSIQFKKASGGTGHTLSINSLKEYYYKKREVKPTGVGIYYPAILDKLNSFEPISVIEKKLNNYVIIIDEINRGNVSAIFGELITLIEEDKRLGKDEALEVMLPYSKEKFGVPPNVHIIGTMNTADRSVEALDTALRRRFSFTEMMPNVEVVKNKDFQDLDRVSIMQKINQRIELLLDKNYTLGHSYFIKDNFKNSFENEIIPLLQEYFYNDCGKIGLILGKGFVREKEISKNNEKSIFADFETKSEIDIIKSYELIPFTDVVFEQAIQTLLA